MKKIASGFISLSILFLLSVNAVANHKDLKEHITVASKMWVNGIEVKPGRYTVRYNSESGEMTLSMKDKVVVQVKATVITNTEKFDQDALLTRETANGVELIGIRLGGRREELNISQMTAEVDAISFVFPDAIWPVSNDNHVISDYGYTITEDGYVVFDVKRQ